jgi:acetyl-CoA carboxylase carboxyl transferase subunit alpha
MTAKDLLEMKLIDGIIPEPEGGAHLDPEVAIAAVRRTVQSALGELTGLSTRALIEQRYQKFREMGNFFSEAKL